MHAVGKERRRPQARSGVAGGGWMINDACVSGVMRNPGVAQLSPGALPTPTLLRCNNSDNSCTLYNDA
jgi:hypothetical protein